MKTYFRKPFKTTPQDLFNDAYSYALAFYSEDAAIAYAFDAARNYMA